MAESTDSVAENWCHTQVKKIKFSLLWTVDNFRSPREEMGDVLTSSIFSVENNDKLKWCLKVCPKGFDAESKDYVSFFLCFVPWEEAEVDAEIEFSILNAQKEKMNVRKIQRVHRFVQGLCCGYKKFICKDFLLDKANGLLPYDKLTLHCEINVEASPMNRFGQRSAIPFKVPSCHLSDDIGQLFESQKFSDVILSANVREFAAHKAILTARSRVFSAMFEHDMKEKKQNKVEIPDMDHEVLREMLHYIYTGKISNIGNMAGDLLFAADKYALDRLKDMCEEHICSNVTVSNAAEVLCLADMHRADRLKAHVVNFIAKHANDVMKTPGWQAMTDKNPHPVAEAFRTLASQQSTSVEPPQKRMKIYDLCGISLL